MKEMIYQFRLQIILDEVDQEMHDCLRNAVLNALPNDVEVRLDQTFWKEKKNMIKFISYEFWKTNN